MGDTAIYWYNMIDHAPLIKPGGFFDYLKMAVKSVSYNDYNYLPAVIPTIIGSLFGTSRLVFILVIANAYTLTGLVALTKAAERLCGLDNARALQLSALFAFLSIPVITNLTVIGFLDTGGLIFCGLVVFLYARRDSLPHCAMLGFILVALQLFRRWYIFWVISFILLACIHQIYEYLTKNQTLKSLMMRLAAAGLAYLAPMILLLPRLTLDLIQKTDYSNAYSAYWRPVSTDISAGVTYFGLLALLLTVCGAVWLALRKKYLPAALVCHAMLTFALFRLIQGHGQQHYLLYIPAIFITLTAAVHELLTMERLVFKKYKRVLYVFMAAVALGSFITLYTVKRDDVVYKPYYIFPRQSNEPIVRNDMPELLRLGRDLDTLTAEMPGARIGVVASSWRWFFSGYLTGLEHSLNLPMEGRRSYLISNSAVDSRDNKPRYLYDCPYVVVADPVQLHLDADVQTVVTAPHSAFMNGTTIGAAFIKTEHIYHLDNDITVYIFKKYRDVTYEEKAAFETMMPNVR